MELAKNRDEIVSITPVAIDKVGRVEIPGFTAALNDELQRHHKELLYIAMNANNSNEVLRIWNINTGEFVDTPGSATKVKPGDNPAAVLFYSKAKPLSLGYLHNHPSTVGFSLADINTFFDNEAIALITVVTNQGEIYSFYKTENYNPDVSVELYNQIVTKLGGVGIVVRDNFAKEFSRICRRGGIIYGRR